MANHVAVINSLFKAISFAASGRFGTCARERVGNNAGIMDCYRQRLAASLGRCRALRFAAPTAFPDLRSGAGRVIAGALGASFSPPLLSFLVRCLSDTFRPFIISTISPRRWAAVTPPPPPAPPPPLNVG